MGKFSWPEKKECDGKRKEIELPEGFVWLEWSQTILITESWATSYRIPLIFTIHLCKQDQSRLGVYDNSQPTAVTSAVKLTRVRSPDTPYPIPPLLVYSSVF
ncbi:hypothetical protein E5676_scaffold255G005950 [Cucumis melo var. makuwa]|uniref:Uncharacterized protein n=1 Tax=Cucumis melo var. makuwa TaxID=1194695 RepID=A0A5D3CM28_CUCMM|nr:hypothetical protein E5676_scaffold255G005950 [Cucumis melo var. makuwa]